MLVILAVLIGSVILHEVAHGWVALAFGDDTAKRAGRLTLNPIPHIDPVFTILLPIICLMIGGPIIGGAKPVPVDFDRFAYDRKADLCVTLAGVAVNLILAVVAGLILRSGVTGNSIAAELLIAVTYINLILAFFNLMPIPPLDGWRVWGAWLPYEWRMFMEMNAMWFMLGLFVLIPYLPIFRFVRVLFFWVTGINI